jgi:hypothetical protein
MRETFRNFLFSGSQTSKKGPFWGGPRRPWDEYTKVVVMEVGFMYVN